MMVCCNARGPMRAFKKHINVVSLEKLREIEVEMLLQLRA